MTIKILLVDDHSIFRESLRSMLESVEEFRVVGESASGRSCVDLAIATQPDIVVMDISLQDVSDLEATQAILERIPGCKVIILSMHEQRQFFMSAIKAGARGYLLKDCSSQEFISCVKAVVAGGTCFSPKLSTHLIADSAIPQEQSSALSSREIGVLKLVAEGMNTKEIAFNLHISIKTVETHRIHIMRKLKINSIAELTKYAIREGIATI